MSLQLTKVESPRVAGYEEVWVAKDPDVSYHAIFAVHSTQLGPALGGTRLMRYADEEAALTDVLRLARGMTYKCAAASIPLGGGKSVILEPPHGYDRAALLRAHGRVVAAGTPDDVMNATLLEQVYDWPLVIVRDPAVGAPSLVPLRRTQSSTSL